MSVESDRKDTDTVGILYDRIRWEEKEISRHLEERGFKAQMIDGKLQVLSLDLVAPSIPPVVIERCVSFYRGMNIASVFEAQGVRMINSSKVLDICGNKLATSLLLSRNGIPSPKTVVAFSAESAMQAIDAMGYPCVMKPIVGSWGRQVVPVRDRETAEALIELREQQGDSIQSIFYVQEMINRPPRDIRCITVGDEIVASVYRYAPQDTWKTNVALGGRTEPCPMTSELQDIVSRTSKIVGEGILGIDVMEKQTTGELVVHEVNGTVEFKGAQSATPHSIADKVAKYAILQLKEGASGAVNTLQEIRSHA
jgi:[lysine-biosynthesis-protein LysW]--L-2-aminoadipate ligase